MKKIIYIFIIVVMIFIPSKVYAVSINDMEIKLKELESYYVNKSYSYNSNLIYSELNSISNEIITLKESISSIEDEIREYEELIKIKKKETNEYLRFLQMSGNSNAYLKYLFDSSDLTEFIYKYGVVSQLSDYNDSVINSYYDLIYEFNDKRNYLINKTRKLEEKKGSYNFKLNSYRVSNTLDSEGGSLLEDIKFLRDKINYYKNKGCNTYSDISLCEDISYSDNKWYYPIVKGCVTSSYTGDKIRSEYEELGGHYGIDLDCSNEGEKIYSANDGVVAQIGKYSCGGNFVYIYHNIDNTYYTTVYMHLLSINVKVGDVVTKDSVIGLMGGYSTSVDNGGYDRCTKGTHLHFGISKGYNISTDEFNINSFNPNNILDFPEEYYDSKKFFYR